MECRSLSKFILPSDPSTSFMRSQILLPLQVEPSTSFMRSQILLPRQVEPSTSIPMGSQNLLPRQVEPSTSFPMGSQILLPWQVGDEMPMEQQRELIKRLAEVVTESGQMESVSEERGG